MTHVTNLAREREVLALRAEGLTAVLSYLRA
jgi:hypothetical protein